MKSSISIKIKTEIMQRAGIDGFAQNTANHLKPLDHHWILFFKYHHFDNYTFSCILYTVIKILNIAMHLLLDCVKLVSCRLLMVYYKSSGNHKALVTLYLAVYTFLILVLLHCHHAKLLYIICVMMCGTYYLLPCTVICRDL